MTQRTTRRVLQLVAMTCAVALGAVGAIVVRPAPPPARELMSAIDVGFAQDMGYHHQQAVMMADMVAHDAAAEVLALADQIRVTQLREMGIMTGWLQLAGQPLSSSAPMAWMHANQPDVAVSMPHHAPTMPMPGLATTQDLQRLQQTSGRANETAFLQLMARHHQGGIEMAAYAIAHSKTPAIHDTATMMVADQTEEVQLISVMLQQRGSAPLPFP